MTADTLTVRRVAGTDHLQFVYRDVTYGHPSTGAAESSYKLSRLLTGTTDEQGAGVFAGPGYGLLDCVIRLVNRHHRPATVVAFEAKGQTRTFRFNALQSDDDLAYLKDEILDRVAAVRAWVAGIGPGETLAFEVPE